MHHGPEMMFTCGKGLERDFEWYSTWRRDHQRQPGEAGRGRLRRKTRRYCKHSIELQPKVNQ